MTAEQFWDSRLATTRGRKHTRRPFTIQLDRAFKLAESYAATQLAELKNKLDIAEGHWEHYAREFEAAEQRLQEAQAQITKIQTEADSTIKAYDERLRQREAELEQLRREVTP